MPDKLLWELSQEVLELERQLNETLEGAEAGPEDPEALAKHQALFDEWLNLGNAFSEKVLAVAAYIRHETAVAEARRAEAKRMTDLARAAEAKVERLKTYLTNQLTLVGRDRIEGTDGVVSLRKSPGTVVLLVEDETELPPEFQRVKISADKTALKAALKAGQATKWARLDTRPILSIK